VATAVSQPTGFSPGVASRLRLADGSRVFVKAVGSVPNPDTPSLHRREAGIVAALPTAIPAPRLLWSYDDADTGWVVLVFEDVDGRHPAQPWDISELHRILDALSVLAEALTPSPLVPPIVTTASDAIANNVRGWGQLRDVEQYYLEHLDAWSVRHLDALAELESRAVSAVAGNTLLHFDVRADNILLTPEKVWFVDWPWACVGAAWVDVVFFAPSVTMQGGPPPEYMIEHHPSCRTADPGAITAVVAAMAGYFTHQALKPPPPGLPTLRAFQAAQGAVARGWVRQRTGWT
jgi:aminoglycoside phosphotransferase (APT) family kinase protein